MAAWVGPARLTSADAHARRGIIGGAHREPKGIHVACGPMGELMREWCGRVDAKAMTPLIRPEAGHLADGTSARAASR